MSRTGNYVEQLRQRIDEVYDLGDEEQQHGLAEMAKNAHHSKGHPSKVTERVSYKH